MVRNILTYTNPPARRVRTLFPVDHFQDEVNQLFKDFFGEAAGGQWPGAVAGAASADFAPVIDVKETESGFVVVAEIPGVDSKDIDIDISEGRLTISGEKKLEKNVDEEGYFRQEISYGSFKRVINLPENIDIEHASANAKNGVMTINIPKVENPKKARKLEIKTE